MRRAASSFLLASAASDLDPGGLSPFPALRPPGSLRRADGVGADLRAAASPNEWPLPVRVRLVLVGSHTIMSTSLLVTGPPMLAPPTAPSPAPAAPRPATARPPLQVSEFVASHTSSQAHPGFPSLPPVAQTRVARPTVACPRRHRGLPTSHGSVLLSLQAGGPGRSAARPDVLRTARPHLPRPKALDPRRTMKPR